MTDLTEIEMTRADSKDIEEYESLTKQIQSVETFEELMPLLKKRARIRNRILGAPLHLIKGQVSDSL